jgi:hypothetical protein
MTDMYGMYPALHGVAKMMRLQLRVCYHAVHCNGWVILWFCMLPVLMRNDWKFHLLDLDELEALMLYDSKMLHALSQLQHKVATRGVTCSLQFMAHGVNIHDMQTQGAQLVHCPARQGLVDCNKHRIVTNGKQVLKRQ